jgi:hypothetical protein
VNPVIIGCIVLSCVFGGAIVGMFLHQILPEHHLSTESKDVIKLGMALTSTMSALVLALLIASAKTSYDAQRNELTQISATIILLDRGLAHYGPETADAREVLHRYVVQMLVQLWSNDNANAPAEPTSAVGASFYDKVEALSPHNEVQSSLKLRL